MIYIFLLLATLTFFTGCGPTNKDIIKEVLEKDPSFEKALEIKRGITAKIYALQDNFKKEKSAISDKMRALRTELAGRKNFLNTQVFSLKQVIKPEIDERRARLEDTLSEYKLKSREFKFAEAKLKNIRKLLEKKIDISLSGDEISVWKKRVTDLEREIDSLHLELDKLRSKVRLLKTELQILKE